MMVGIPVFRHLWGKETTEKFVEGGDSKAPVKVLKIVRMTAHDNNDLLSISYTKNGKQCNFVGPMRDYCKFEEL